MTTDNVLLGIDCEWQPESKGHSKVVRHHRVSILQLATVYHVLIIDLIAIPFESIGIFLEPLKFVLASEKVKKIGFDIRADLSRLFASLFPISSLNKTDEEYIVRNIVDLKTYSPLGISSAELTDVKSNVKKKVCKTSFLSLTKLSNHILGRPLDKSQQCSSWGSRPLTTEQISYAAVDAAVLLSIYQTIMKKSDGDASFQDIIGMSFSVYNSVASEARQDREKQSNSTIFDFSNIDISSILVVNVKMLLE
jgi:hypothetical protein